LLCRLPQTSPRGKQASFGQCRLQFPNCRHESYCGIFETNPGVSGILCE
jgi:hypothetical protein